MCVFDCPKSVTISVERIRVLVQGGLIHPVVLESVEFEPGLTSYLQWKIGLPITRRRILPNGGAVDLDPVPKPFPVLESLVRELREESGMFYSLRIGAIDCPAGEEWEEYWRHHLDS